MSGRERYDADIVCKKCGQGGNAKFSELANAIFHNDHPDLVVEWLSNGFHIGEDGELKVVCARCGSSEVYQVEPRRN